MHNGSLHPPRSRKAQYTMMGIAVILAVIGAWLLFARTDAPAATAVTAGKPGPQPDVKRSTSMAEQTLELPEEESDAGAPPATKEQGHDGKKSAKSREPRPAESGWRCMGDIRAGHLSSIMGTNRQQVRSCYEKRLKINNVLQGSVMLKLKVGSQGQISDIRLSGTLKDSILYQCIRQTAAKWKLPAPLNGTCAVVQIPFNFEPQN